MEQTITAYHQLLLALWKTHAAAGLPGCEAMPYLGQAPEPGKTVDVVFLGINPSLHPAMLAEHWQAVHADGREVLAPAPWLWDGARSDATLESLHRQLVALDHHSRDNFPRFYKPLADVAAAAGAADTWHPLDVLPLRVSTQSSLEAHLPAEGDWHPFLEQLFDAGVEVLRALQPKVVVVANSYAAQLLRARLPLVRQANGHRYDTTVVPGATFLLSGMLSYGVTDMFSRERLVADLRNVLAGKSGLD